MKKIIGTICLFMTVFEAFAISSFAHAKDLIEIVDEETPTTAASHCTTHWGVLGITGLFGIFLIIRALVNRNALFSESQDKDER